MEVWWLTPSVPERRSARSEGPGASLIGYLAARDHTERLGRDDGLVQEAAGAESERTTVHGAQLRGSVEHLQPHRSVLAAPCLEAPGERADLPEAEGSPGKEVSQTGTLRCTGLQGFARFWRSEDRCVVTI